MNKDLVFTVCFKRFVLFIVLTYIFQIQVFSQSNSSWVKNYGGTGDDKAYAIVIDKDGFIYVTGYTTQPSGNIDIYINKLNSSGVSQWTQTYDGPGHSDDKAYAIALDKQNNVIVAGFSTGVGTHHDFTILKYTSNGGFTWVQSYNAPFNNDDEAVSVVCDDSLNVYATGFITNIGTYYYTMKFNQNGTPQWGQPLGGSGNGDNKAYGITIDKSANIYVTGYVSNTDGGFDCGTVKYNLNGVQQWVSIFSNPGNADDKAYAIAIDKLGFIYITGYCTDPPHGTDFLTIKYDSSGQTVWTSKYDGIGHSDDKAYAITLDSSNNPYITGSSRSSNSPGSEDYLTIKLNTEHGDTVWTARYYYGQNGGPDIPYAIHIPKNNSAVYVTGSSWTDTTKGMDIATVKYSLSGELLQEKRFNGSGDSTDAALDIASDTSGTIYLCGYESVLNRGADIFVSKFYLGDLIAVTPISGRVPDGYVLHQNYPNPFNPYTRIKFEVPRATVVKIAVFDILGREVLNLVNKYMPAGQYEVEFNSEKLASGVYLYKMSANDFQEVKKMVLIK